MNPFEMTVLIVALVVLGRVLVAHSRPAAPDAPADSATTAAESARLREDIAALKRRVATLERIATDRSTMLDHEIEALRDRP